MLKNTLCPLCKTDVHDRQMYAMNFRPEDLSSEVFSARRPPDRLHYRMVRCTRCGLLRSNPILESGELKKLYESSHFTYEREAAHTCRTYGEYLRRACERMPDRGRLLEIGCGNAFFLEEALRQGFREVFGVEPSAEAVALAPGHIRPFIRQDLYGPDSFPGEQFDVVCAFQVFDHAPDPAGLLRACHKHLKPGGLALFINHDSGALSARLLGELSPIIDVEHTVLFDRTTMAAMFRRAGFVVREVFPVRNRYPLGYWMKLAPLPAILRSALLRFLSATGLGRLPVTLSAGNLGLVATKA